MFVSETTPSAEENLETTEVEQEVQAPAEPEAMIDTVRRSINQVGEKADEKDDVQGDKASEEPKPATKAAESEATKAARTLANLKNRGKGPKQAFEAKELDVPGKPATKAAGNSEKRPEMPTRFEPPARFPVDKKEWFLKQPKEVQEEAVKGWGEIESQFTKLSQDMSREKTRYSEANQVLDYYLPRWNINNITPAQAIQQLCAAQDLITQDPVRGITLLMQKSGVKLEHLQDAPSEPQQFSSQASPAQQSRLTHDDIRQILAEERQQQQMSTQIAADDQAADSVRRKVGPNGQYLYPELWDGNNSAGNHWNAEFCERAKPLVAAYRKTQPGLPMSDAIERAVKALRYADGMPGSPSPTGQRLPQQTANIQEIKRASLSTRSRGAPTIPTIANGKSNERVDETVRRSIAQLKAQMGG